ncbi:SPW repeat protein [Streptomonospora algeriensis]
MSVSYVWHGLLGIGMAVLFLLGVLLVFLACLAVIHPELFVTEAATAVTGLLLIASPWLAGFADIASAALTAWLAGTVAVVTGLVTLPSSVAMYRRIVPPQPMG